MTRPDRRSLPAVALLLGDATGIGPELVARVLSDGRLDDAARIVVVADGRVLRQGMEDAGVSVAWHSVSSVAAIDWDRPGTPVLDLGNIDPARFPRGAVSTESGRLTGDTLAHAVAMAQRGEVDAITFAPLNKAALHGGGWRFPDEHKMFAHLLGHEGHFAEMNVLDGQWMSRVTGHLSLREAVDRVTGPNIVDAIRLADRTMRRAGIARPRLAVAALNPPYATIAEVPAEVMAKEPARAASSAGRRSRSSAPRSRKQPLAASIAAARSPPTRST